jgi:Ca2+-binding EF-hand superfamily protein
MDKNINKEINDNEIEKVLLGILKKKGLINESEFKKACELIDNK